MRKILSLVIVLMLALCLATTAFAAEPNFIMDPTVPTNVVLEAGATVEYQGRVGGMILTITNAADLTVTVDGNPCTADGTGTITCDIVGGGFFAPPTSIVITNSTAAQVTAVMSFAYPLGTMENPEPITLGSNSVDVTGAAAYYFKYTATSDGVLVLTVDGTNWIASVANLTSYIGGEYAYGDAGDTYAACGMSAGDELMIEIGSADWNPDTLNFTLSVVDHITEAVAAGEAKCHTPSNIAHYYCEYCGGYFQDEAATQPLTEGEVFGAALGATNVTHVPEVPAECHEDGTAEHWICGGCDGYFADEDCTIETSEWSLGLGATGAVDVEHIQAVPAGCHSIGNIEHWICGGCGAYFEDEGCWWEIEPELVTIAATGAENITHVEKLDPECHNHGMQEHWICDDCNGYFSDAECTQQVMQPRYLYIPAEVELEHYAEVPAECHSNGNIEHWFCPECEGFYLDAEGIRVTNSLSVTLPATGATTVTHVAGAEPYCHRNGVQEHWICDDCGGYFSDAECTQQVMQPRYLIIPAEETLEYHEKVAPTCVENGMEEYWYCAACDCYFTDAEGIFNIASKRLVIEATGKDHVLEHHEAADPVCHRNGNVEYWYCGECDCYFVDVEGNLVNSNAKNVVIPAENTLEHHKKVAATCDKNGMEEYWYCDDCDCYFTDAEGIFNIASKRLVILATGHNYVDGECANCGSDNPKTGDAGIMGAVVTLLTSAMSTVALIIKKKEF